MTQTAFEFNPLSQKQFTGRLFTPDFTEHHSKLSDNNTKKLANSLQGIQNSQQKQIHGRKDTDEVDNTVAHASVYGYLGSVPFCS